MFSNWTSREKKLLGILGVCLLIVAGFLFSSLKGAQEGEEGMVFQSYEQGTPSNPSADGPNGFGQDGETDENMEEGSSHSGETADPGSDGLLMIDVKGAVAQPDVYTFEEGMRITDALEKAGGLLEEGSTQTVNLAQPLTDGMVIYVPTEDEVEQGLVSPVSSSETNAAATHESTSAKVNINTASAGELEGIPGIGPSRAEAIIRYREENGGYSQIEDIMNVSGIGSGIFENIRDEIEI